MAFETGNEDARAFSEAEFRIRQMTVMDLASIAELRSVVEWSADPEAFDLLRGMHGSRWAVAEGPDGVVRGMVGAVPLGETGILCHLAVHDGYRNLGLGTRLTAWAVAYLKACGAKTIRLYTTSQAEKLYRYMNFRPVAMRAVYRLEKPDGKVRSREEAGDYRVETLLFGDLPELYGIDLWSYGAERSHLILATLRLHPGRGLVARDSSGRMRGYLIRSSSQGATRIGPFMAANTTVARSLLARALHTGGREPVQLTISGSGPVHELLREFGFSGRPDRLMMELGEGGSSPRSLVQYATTAYLAT